jgi:amino acid transporter
LIEKGVLALGVKESSRMNNIFTSLNLLVVAFIIVAGGTQADWNNWSISASDVSILLCSQFQFKIC